MAFFRKKKKAKEPEMCIGTPYQVQHEAHVGFDQNTGTFQGLPNEWKALLGSSGLGKEEIEDNQEMVLKVLQFQHNMVTGQGAPPPPPRRGTSSGKLPPAKPSPWSVHNTPEGHKYWYNKETQESSWTEPEDIKPKPKPAPQVQAPPALAAPKPAPAATPTPAKPSPWTEHNTPEGHKYWYNKETQASSWTEPEDLKTPASAAVTKPKPSLPAIPVAVPASPPSTKQIAWSTHFTPEGHKYWYNKDNGESVWTEPEELAAARPTASLPPPPQKAPSPQQATPPSLTTGPPVPQRGNPIVPPTPMRAAPAPPPSAQSGPPPAGPGAAAGPPKRRKLADIVSPGNPNDIYTDLKLVGLGASGSVYKATDSRDGAVVAIKQMIIAQQRNKSVVINEIELMRSCSHRAIVNFKDCYMVEGTLWVVMEFVDGCDLTQVITVAAPMEEKMVALIIRDSLQALEHLHEMDVVHRDIKSDNIMCGEDGRVMLTDFGFGAQLGGASGASRTSVVGTTYWMAPEVIKAEPYDTRVDVWSTGVMAYEMIEGSPPYMDQSTMKALFLIVSKGLPGFTNPISDPCKDFILQCCTMDPAVRPTATELLKHPFLSVVGDQGGLVPLVAKAKDEAARNLEEDEYGEGEYDDEW